MNQLVTLTTQDVSRAYPVTDSLVIAEQFNKRHDIVLRDIRKLAEDLRETLVDDEISLYKIEESVYQNDRGRAYTRFDMNESFFMLLVMGYTGKKALKIKNRFIKQFISMKHELTMRSNTRHIGVNVRKDMTKMISNNIEDYQGGFKKFAISNYTRMIYKKVLGMQIKKWKIENNYPADCKARDYMNKEQIDQVQIYESKIADIIEFNTDEDPKVLYKKIQEFINK